MSEPARVEPGVALVARQEVQDIWLGGRGPLLIVGYALVLSVVTYLTASNQALNFLEQKEAVSFTLQVAVAVGALLVLVVGADAISGERERGTLEGLLLTPVPRRALVLGKLLGALSLWLVCLLVTVPYLVVLGRGVGLVGQAVLLQLVVGSALATGLAAVGLIFSGLSASNRTSLSASLLLLLALFAPTQLPSGAQQGWFGSMLNYLNPVASGEGYLGAVLVKGHPWAADLGLLVSPAVLLVLGLTVLLVAERRLLALEAGAR